MSHNIETFEDGTSAFVSARIPAWHKLGVVTNNALTAEQALEIAQLDSIVTVSENPVGAVVDGKVISVADKFITYRNHPKTGITGLGVVGKRYVPIQNKDAFSFLTNLVDESGAIFETAGSINDGRQVFMTLKMPQTMQIANKADSSNLYIVAVNSHDGSKSFKVLVTPVRVVCTNTVNMALKSAVREFSLRHTQSAQGKVQQARQTLDLVYKYADEFEKKVAELIDQSYTDSQFEKLVETLLPLDADASQVGTTKVTNKRNELLGLWKAETQANIANTKWAAYNAVVEYADWFSPVRGDDRDTARAKRIVTGSLDGFKNKALTLLG